MKTKVFTHNECATHVANWIWQNIPSTRWNERNITSPLLGEELKLHNWCKCLRKSHPERMRKDPANINKLDCFFPLANDTQSFARQSARNDNNVRSTVKNLVTYCPSVLVSCKSSTPHPSPLPKGRGEKEICPLPHGGQSVGEREHLAVWLPSCLAAFTLAEVLITLGIIGVVAAVTMPILIQNHKKQVVETRLQKFYSTINQAIKLSEVEYGDKAGWTPADTDDFFNTYLKKHLSYISYENKRVGTGNDWRLVNLPDGSAFIFDIYGTWDEDGNQTYKTNGGHFIFCPYAKNCIDGRDNTKWGKTQFVFGYWPAGEVMPKYHKDKGVEPYLNEWDGNEETLYTSKYGCNAEATKNFYCTAVIQHNGWKIPKDYPYRF